MPKLYHSLVAEWFRTSNGDVYVSIPKETHKNAPFHQMPEPDVSWILSNLFLHGPYALREVKCPEKCYNCFFLSISPDPSFTCLNNKVGIPPREIDDPLEETCEHFVPGNYYTSPESIKPLMDKIDNE